MDRETRLKRLKFRSWHRGTREADLMIGGYFDAHSASWSDADMDWFETFLEEQDVDIMAWACSPPRPGSTTPCCTPCGKWISCRFRGDLKSPSLLRGERWGEGQPRTAPITPSPNPLPQGGEGY